MRTNLSYISKPIKRRRSATHLVCGGNCYPDIGYPSKLPTYKRTLSDAFSIDSNSFNMTDLDCWRQQDRKYRVDLPKLSLSSIGGRQQLTLRKRRRSIRQHRQQQKARRYIPIYKQLNYPNGLDADQISQWSVPLVVAGPTLADDQLDICRFPEDSQYFPLIRSQSQQNFCNCDETGSYEVRNATCYEVAPIELTTADSSDLESQGDMSNVEPNLNHYVGNCRKVQIHNDCANDENEIRDVGNEVDNGIYNADIMNNYIKDEDNLFDSLCHSGCQCSDTREKSNNSHDLLRCAEIQKSDIAAKAFLIFVEYCATKCNITIHKDGVSSIYVRDKWQSLSQKEKLPFLLQAYISDYMPNN